MAPTVAALERGEASAAGTPANGESAAFVCNQTALLAFKGPVLGEARPFPLLAPGYEAGTFNYMDR
jgi:hypothetical protein